MEKEPVRSSREFHQEEVTIGNNVAQEQPPQIDKQVSHDVGVGVVAGLFVAFILMLVAFINGKLRNVAKIYLIDAFRITPFIKRIDCFEYRQNRLNLPVCKSGDVHLQHKSLLGVIEPPSFYGTYTKESGQSHIVLNERRRGKEFRKISKYIQKCILPYRIKIECQESKKKQKDWVEFGSADYIISNYILPSISSDSPRMYMIRGKVGCGKSTLVTDLSNKITQFNGVKNTPGDIAAIVINVRKLLFKQFRFNEDFHETIFQPNFSRDVLLCLKEEVVSVLKEIKVPNIHLGMDYDDAIDICYKNLISPLIVFDEVDYLYTDFSKRTIADKDGPSNKCIDMFKEIFREICSIHLNTPISRSTTPCNTILFVVARSSTKRLMGDLLEEEPMRDICHIKIDEASKERINEIILAQLNLLSRTSEGLVNRNINSLINLLKENKIDYTKNISVSVHGVRHLINAIVKIRDFDNGAYELLKLVAGNPGLLRLYQYIDGNPDYTQAEEGISNIYLVNRDSPLKCREFNCDDKGYDIWLLQDHLQTYWLKYFLCEYIVKKTRVVNGGRTEERPIYFDEVVKVFHTSNCREYTQYEESIIKLALLNASKVDHGRLVKFGFREGEGKLILPSSRLLYMNKEKLFWDFGYLMVVIEDKWLEFPKEIYDLFVCEDDKTVYSFITKYHISSTNDKIDYLKFKAKQVLAFFLVLEKSLEYEKKRYRAVFRRLEEAQVEIEVIEVFKNHLSNSIEDFSKTYVGEGAAEELRKYVKEFDLENSSLIGKIENCFNTYHGGPSLRSLDSKMKNYYMECEQQ